MSAIELPTHSQIQEQIRRMGEKAVGKGGEAKNAATSQAASLLFHYFEMGMSYRELTGHDVLPMIPTFPLEATEVTRVLNDLIDGYMMRVFQGATTQQEQVDLAYRFLAAGLTEAEIRRAMSRAEIEDKDEIVRRTELKLRIELLIEKCLADALSSLVIDGNMPETIIFFNRALITRMYSEVVSWPKQGLEFTRADVIEDFQQFWNEAVNHLEAIVKTSKAYADDELDLDKFDDLVFPSELLDRVFVAVNRQEDI